MNVVVILLESFRSRSLTPYDPTLTTTPFLDSLAQHGLLVDEMYAIVPYTNKSLTPILAGIYPDPSFHVVEADLEVLPGPGLPSLLQPFGYRSAFFTPADLGFERKDRILGHLGFGAMFGDRVEQRAGRRQVLAGLEQRLQAGEDHRPAAVELVVGALAQLVVRDDEPA